MSEPLPFNEEKRLLTLRQYAVLDTPPEANFDAFTKLASLVCQKSISLISLVDTNRQWFKSKIGLDLQETHQDDSFCTYAILDPSNVLIVKDTLKDERFKKSALVNKHPYIRFYAGAPIVSPNGYAIGTLCVMDQIPSDLSAEQIKALKLMAQQISEQLELRKYIIDLDIAYNTFFDQAPDAVFLLDLEGHHKKVNMRAAQMLGYEPEEIAKLSVNELSADLDASKNVINQLLDGKTIPTYERLFRKKDGSLLPVEINISLLYGNDNQPHFIQSIVRDISDRKQAEHDLRANEEKYRNLTQTANDAIITANKQGIIQGWNHGAENIFGYKAEEILNRPLETLMPIPYRDLHHRGMARILKGGEKHVIGKTVELEGLHKSGKVFPIELSLSQWESSKETFFTGVIRNITERKVAQDKIKAQLKRLQALHHIDTTINGALNLQLTLDIALDEILTQLDVDAADILLMNTTSYVLKFLQGKGFQSNEIKESHIRYGEGVAGRALLDKKIIHLIDPLHSQNWLRTSLLQKENFVEYYATPLAIRGRMVGVLELFNRSHKPKDDEWASFFETIAEQIAIAIDNNRLFTELEQSNIRLVQAYDATIEGWSRALDLRDKETEGHTLRVTNLTVQLMKNAGVSEDELIHIQRGALLHDIGKMGIPDEILLKPDKLTNEEWDVMRQHPRFAFNLLSPIKYLQPALDIPYCHHEKWDGSGYPRKLKGEEIPFSARIFAVVDVWDALRSDRPYRKSWTPEKAMEHILSLSGIHFDPRAVDLFVKFIRENKEFE